MLFDLKDIFMNEGMSSSKNYDLDLSKLDVDGCFPFTTPVHVKAKVMNTAGIVSITLETEYDYTRPCDRCFTDTKSHMNEKFSHKLIESLEEDYNDDYIETPDMVLDVDDLVTSDILLNLPHKYLCKEDCQGLCQKCGKNLNLGSCDCEKKDIDPRLEKLKELLN